MAPRVVDRREALKRRHHAAILDAARALIDERSGPHFSVDELADRADVARRTVFNHFGSSSGVVLALAEEVISDRVRDMMANAVSPGTSDRSRPGMFRIVSETLRASDLAPGIAELARILAGVDDGRTSQLIEETFTRVAIGLYSELLRVDPGADPLDAELLIGAVMGGVNVIARRWVASPDDRSSPAAHAEWEALLDQCLEAVRLGYTSTAVDLAREDRAHDFRPQG